MAQDYDGFKGRGVYHQYDKTYISPFQRGKHSVSLGTGIANVSPQNTWSPNWGIHLGYNYLLLEKRKRIFGIKETFRDELRMGFGGHFHYWFNGEWFLHAVYLNPTLALRGKILGFYFFNEFGFGLHRSPQKLDEPSKVRFNVIIEPLKFRFGKSPLYLSLKVYYDTGSALLSKNRMDLATSATLNYFIYKKYNKNKTKRRK